MDTLKVRQKQSTKAKVLTLVSRDDSYKVLGESAEWVNVKADGDKGYLAKDYVSLGYYYTSAKSNGEKTKAGKEVPRVQNEQPRAKDRIPLLRRAETVPQELPVSRS